jgi:hypothetical protein
MIYRTLALAAALAVCGSACKLQIPGVNTSGSASSGGASSGGSSGGGGGGSSAIANTPETWKRFEIRGVQLGMPMASLKDFTCTDRAKRHEYAANCYKLTDARCKQGNCVLKQDAMGQWWEIDGVKEDPEIVVVTLTDSDDGLIYQIRLKIGPRQLLDKDTTLGKAMIAKYGEPTESDPTFGKDQNGGGRMRWFNSDHFGDYPNFEVDCESNYKDFCHVTAEAGAILENARSKQKVIDEKRLRDKQPTTAPQL